MEKPQRSIVFCCFKQKMHVTDVPKTKDTRTNSTPKKDEVKPRVTNEVKPILIPNSEPIKTTTIPVTEEPKPRPQSEEVTPAAIPIIEEVKITAISVTEEAKPSPTPQSEEAKPAAIPIIEEVKITVISVTEEAEPSPIPQKEEVQPAAIPIIEEIRTSFVEEIVESSETLSTEQLNGTTDIKEEISETSVTEEVSETSVTEEVSETSVTEEVSETSVTEQVNNSVSNGEVMEVATEPVSNGEVVEVATESVGDGSELVTESLFTDILEKQFGKNTIKYFNVKKSSGGGENYMSWMFYVSIDFEKEDGCEEYASYIVKMMPPNDPQAQFKNAIKAFPKEVEMYEQMVPKFEELFRENGIDIQFAPKCWKTTNEPYEILILEDLKAHKFENINRLEGMDLQHAEMVLEKLAKFHAASACLYENSGTFSNMLMDDVMTKEMEPMFKAMQSTIWSQLCKSMHQWDTCQEYVDRLENLTDRGDLYTAAFKRDDNEFNVVLHGDFWANNIMFREDENGVAKEVLFVDLQVSRYGPPMQDLVYFILSSTHRSIKIEKFDYMISYYHRELVKNLNLFKYPKQAPTIIDLQASILKRIFYGLIVCTGVMAIALVPPREDASIENFMGGEESQFMTDTYMNPRFIQSCEIILPFLDNKGVFDV